MTHRTTTIIIIIVHTRNAPMIFQNAEYRGFSKNTIFNVGMTLYVCAISLNGKLSAFPIANEYFP